MGLPEQHRHPGGTDLARGPDPGRPTSRAVIGLLSVIAVILVAWARKASAVVTMPLAFASSSRSWCSRSSAPSRRTCRSGWSGSG